MPFCGPGSLPCCVIPFRRQRLPWHCGLPMAFLIFRLYLKYLLKESLIWPSHYHGTFLISSTEVKAFQHHLLWQSAPQTLPLSLSLRALHVRDMVCFVYCPISAMGHVLERVPKNYGKREKTQIMGTEVILFPFCIPNNVALSFSPKLLVLISSSMVFPTHRSCCLFVLLQTFPLVHHLGGGKV